MSTDGNGINCYFHSLIYWEQFTLHDIKKDYDVDLVNFGKKRTKRQSKIISMSVDNFRIPEKPQPQDKDEYFGVCSLNEMLKFTSCQGNYQKSHEARRDDEKDQVSDDKKTLEYHFM